jgi:3-oxoacyl-[acyl-carrier-protein] synthase-3
MAAAAARECLSSAGTPSSDIGCLIASSASSENRFPGPAAVIAKDLGLVGIPAIDVPVASAGSLFALSLAHQLVRSYGTVLVVASEKMSCHGTAEPLDKNVAILFGDGAGACLVTPDETASSGERCLKILSHALHSDGSFAEDLKLPVAGRVQMNGLAVILQASRKLPAVIQEVATAAAVPLSNVSAFLLHQANRNLLLKVAKTLSVDAARFFSNIERYGNTSSASMLIAAAEWSAQSTPVPGETIVFAAFGAGFHWGALLAEQVN